MRYFRCFLSILFGALLSSSALDYAQQPWSAILSPSRAINWGNAGLPATFTDKGGSNVETTTNPWTPPARTQSGSTISPSGTPSTDLSNINAALSSCNDGQYVLLGPGTFQIQGTISAYLHSCSLRGSGASSTTLAMSSAGNIWMGAAGTGGSCYLTPTSNYSAGSTTITCNGLSGGTPVVGYIASLAQCDTGFSGTPCAGTSADNGGLFVCSFQTTCMTEPSGSGPNNSQRQNFVITSVTNNGGTYTIGLNHGLYMPNWTYAQTPVLTWNYFNYDGVGVGIEDMTIQYTGASSVNWSVQMQNSYASWIKGVRFLGSPMNTAVGIEASEAGLFLNNYIFADIAVDSNYPPSLHSDASSDVLILNNILTNGPNWESDGGDTGVVFAYNYMRDGFTLYTLMGPYDHHAYNSFNLVEGNINPESSEDDTWGTHDLDTYFRNYHPCSDGPYTTWSGTVNPRAMIVGAYQRFMNIVGNAYGTAGLCPTYQGNETGVNIIFGINTGDSLVSSALMRWGNVSVVTQSSDTPTNSGIRFVASEVPNSTNMSSGTYPNATTWQNSTPANNNLPCSFYFSIGSSPCSPKYSGGTGLSWYKVCKTWSAFPTSCSATQTQPFPIAGPDMTSGNYVNGYAYDNPASTAWKNLPIDNTRQNPYSITGSNWSNGTETLTVSGLPSGSVHIMGPMQISGGNCATSGAGTSTGAEVLITGSSVSTSSTVSYALASNPGTCTGTMLFPDIRQFDERVYEADSGQGSSSGTQPAAPGGLTGNVVTIP